MTSTRPSTSGVPTTARRRRSPGWTPSTRSRSAATTTPDNTHHGLLLVNNDDIVKPGTGFDTHPHRDMEIVTWVLRGSLVHQDSTGHSGVIYPGLAQRMSAGRGILHSEKNDSWTSDRRAIPQRASAFRADVGDPRRVGHHARLPAARDRRRVVARRSGDDRVGHARTQRRHRHHDPQPVRGAARRAPAARRQRRTARRLHTCTCSFPAVKSRSRAQGRCTKATPCGSPHRAVSASPPPNPPRFWSGRCMRAWLRRKRIGAALAGLRW